METTKNLIIAGAGGCGREVLQWAKDINACALEMNGVPKWNIKGFINDIPEALNGKYCDSFILAKIDEYRICENDEFICAIGDPSGRRKVIERLKRRGAIFTSVIHPTAIIADTSKIDKAAIIYPNAVVTDNTKIGFGCIINMCSTIGHDTRLGDFCTISAHCDVTGRCTLGNNVFMGTSSCIIPDLKIEENVYICAGSTVMANLKANLKVIGSPAKKIKL